jgi:hypothetical protein
LLLPSAKFHPLGKPKTGKLRLFSEFHKHVSDLLRPGRLISLVSPPSFYPVATASASIRRTMLPNNRRVRWLSAWHRFAFRPLLSTLRMSTDRRHRQLARSANPARIAGGTGSHRSAGQLQPK